MAKAPVKKAPVKKAATKAPVSKAVVPSKGSKAVSVFESEHSLLLEDAGSGLQNVSSQDMSIPFISIVQDLSPQRKKTHEKYIPGCEEGMVFNTLDKSLYDSISFVPCYYNRAIIEWTPRDSGGGFVARHDRTFELPKTVNDKGTPFDAETGHEFQEVVEYYGLVLDPNRDEPYPCLISMSGANHKHSKKWNTVMMQRKVTVSGKRITPPSFAYSYTLQTQPETNKVGQSYYAWDIDLEGEPVSTDVYLLARDLSKSVASMQDNITGSYARSDVM